MRSTTLGFFLTLAISAANAAELVPGKTVVLTFDDAVKSHITFVAPLLKEFDFGATFFVTHRWMDDTENFMSWDDIAELHRMGFEIGNHSWTHPDFFGPRDAARIAGELALVDNELAKVGVPKPVSFAWCGNSFGPEAVASLRTLGYSFARRGMQPEVPYGEIVPGPLYDPAANDPLLIPTAGDAYPDWTLDHFKRVVDRARDGNIAVLQFHGVPDIAHPWVHTPPERFREYMAYLKDNGFRVIALRDIAPYIDRDNLPVDPLATTRQPSRDNLDQPPEVAATRANLDVWLENMLVHHRYTTDEVAQVCAYTPDAAQRAIGDFNPPSPAPHAGPVVVLPYPGGRHTRIGFLDGAIDPQRGTKASVFAPWKNGGYAVIDLPEAIFSNLGLLFLAHTHIPTIWDDANIRIDNVDWTQRPGGGLEFTRTLPNGVRFGAEIIPDATGADLRLWLENATDATLTGLRTQVCVLLKGLDGFEAQTNDNKTLGASNAIATSDDGSRSISITFDHVTRTWANPDCPCIHADPTLPDAAPGQRVETKGRLTFARRP